MDNTDWTPVSTYCPNCGKKSTGYKDSRGVLKLQCQSCRVKIVSVLKSKKHIRLDVFAPV